MSDSDINLSLTQRAMVESLWMKTLEVPKVLKKPKIPPDWVRKELSRKILAMKL